jgi:hypothetical protein
MLMPNYYNVFINIFTLVALNEIELANKKASATCKRRRAAIMRIISGFTKRLAGIAAL